MGCKTTDDYDDDDNNNNNSSSSSSSSSNVLYTVGNRINVEILRRKLKESF
jgi:hypothetical protein